MPVSLTQGAWSSCIAWSGDDSSRQLIQSERIRLDHVLEIAAQAFTLSVIPSSGVLFPVYVVPRDGHSTEYLEITLEAVLVTMDGEPAVIIMLHNEL